MATKRICAVIPAKAVSKRIPGKNLKDLAGKPMLAYILETAQKAAGIDKVFVTTESDEIERVAEAYGAEVLRRPVELTEDAVTTQQVLAHAIAELEKREYTPDYILLLYPTSPLLKRERIEEAVRIALANDSDSVVSGVYDKGHYWKQGADGWRRLYPVELVNSQQQEPLFKENGALYLTKTPILKQQLVADTTDILLMQPDETIDVDYPEDFAAVEKILQGA
jgi:CMP-N,N'-diacetyllegionaminic acid synthase